MGHHTFDVSRADKLENAPDRYRNVSREELLWALALDGTETVADLGSGTGFYTDDVAPHVEQLYGIDIQDEMHDYYRQKGVPENVDLITGGIEDIPFSDSHLTGAFSTMTYHEFVTEESLDELARVIQTGGRLVVADWSAEGTGESGPPVDERYTADEAIQALSSHGFVPNFDATREETFLIVSERE